METFTLSKYPDLITFRGNYDTAREQYYADPDHEKYTFVEWCLANVQKTDIIIPSAPAAPDQILTEDYLTSLGWAKQKQDDNHYTYYRVNGDREQQLLFSVWPEGVMATIAHKKYGTSSNGVFHGKIDSRQTFEIILNAVS